LFAVAFPWFCLEFLPPAEPFLPLFADFAIMLHLCGVELDPLPVLQLLLQDL
jgi:hypothetical protein